MDKYAIAQILREVGFAIELVGEDPKKSITYHRAAKAIEFTEEFERLLSENSLELIPGIGVKIARMIKSLVKMDT